MFAQLEDISTSQRKHLDVFLEERRLRPAFMLLGEVVARRCTLCP
jgi:hypothetical protein